MLEIGHLMTGASPRGELRFNLGLKKKKKEREGNPPVSAFIKGRRSDVSEAVFSPPVIQALTCFFCSTPSALQVLSDERERLFH